MYSRGLRRLGLDRENTPNPQETGGPREFRGLVGWGMGGEGILVVAGGQGGGMGCRKNIWRVDREGKKIWSLK